MAQGISTVGRYVDLYYPVALQMIVFSSRHANLGILRKDNYSRVVVANPNLVLSANHAEAVNATEFRLLDSKLLVTIIKHATKVSDNDFLSCCHIGCATDNLLRLSLAKVNGCYMKVVAIGMNVASKYLADKETLQASLNCLHFFECAYFQSA